MSGIQVAFGGAAIQSQSKVFSSPEQIKELYDALEEGGVKIIDTATLYGDSEKVLSETGAAKRFTIDTKAVGGFVPGNEAPEVVKQHGEQSYKLLGQVDVWYMHSPSNTVDVEETLSAMQDFYKRGFFKRLGVSNYPASEVQKAYDISKKNGWVLPSVYQGNYNAVARGQEEKLFPTLRKLGIAFYAYSPLAGGFLTKSKQDITDKKGRFDPSTYIGEMYSGMYGRPSLLEALEEWDSIANDEGISRAELAYRWVSYNSALSPKYGDAIVIGASSIEQVKKSLAGLKKGPLSDSAVKRIDAIWEKIKHEAPLDNYHK